MKPKFIVIISVLLIVFTVVFIKHNEKNTYYEKEVFITNIRKKPSLNGAGNLYDVTFEFDTIISTCVTPLGRKLEEFELYNVIVREVEFLGKTGYSINKIIE